jgi:hypothetical protein
MKPRNALRAEHLHPLQAPEREEQPERAAGDREQHALGQQLPDDPPASGTERRAHGNLALAAHAAREQEVRDVGAGDEQHAGHGAAEQPDRSAHAADHLLLQRNDAERQPAIGRIEIRELAAQPGGQRIHFLLHLPDGHAGFQPADDVVVLAVARPRRGRSHRERDDDVGVGGVAEGRHHLVAQRKGLGQDADDLIPAAVQLEPASDGAAIAAIAAHPCRVAENRACGRRLGVFLGGEQAADFGPCAEHRQQVGRHAQRADPLGLAAAAGEVLVRAVADRHVLEPRPGVLDVEILCGREPVLADPEAGRSIPQDHQAIGVWVRQRMQQQGAGDAEDGRVGADAQGEREHRREHESGIPPESAERVAHVRAEEIDHGLRMITGAARLGV